MALWANLHRLRLRTAHASVAIAMTKPGWQDLLDRYQVDAVALRQDTGWQEVLMDHNEYLFLRR
jgi:hypothetical protein